MSKKNEAGDVDAQTEKKTKKELILELKNKLHKRLILPEVKSRFDFLYNTFCKCLVCDDTLFDPILCTDCDIISCRSCVTDLDEGSNLYPAFISCKHVNLAEIPDINKRHLEKIKVSCYYNCKTQNLDLFNYSDHIRKCRIRQENKTKHHHYGLQTDNPNKVAKDQEGYSSKILLDKIDKLEITFELTNQKLINENEANKQLAQTFKTALIDERISSNIATKQMFNLFAAYKPIDENEIDILENIETLIEEDQEEEIALEKSLGKNKHEDVLHKIEISGVNLKDNENLCRNVKIEKAVVERRFTIDEIRNLTDEFMNKNIMEFLNKYNIPKIEIKKEVFGKFEEKDELSNILYLKESNTDIEILNNAKFKLVSKRELFIYLILFSIQINAPKVRNLTGVYFSEDLQIYNEITMLKLG